MLTRSSQGAGMSSRGVGSHLLHGRVRAPAFTHVHKHAAARMCVHACMRSLAMVTSQAMRALIGVSTCESLQCEACADPK
eukprot:5524352-Pleurochrysis_carterae.AAC.1